MIRLFNDQQTATEIADIESFWISTAPAQTVLWTQCEKQRNLSYSSLSIKKWVILINSLRGSEIELDDKRWKVILTYKDLNTAKAFFK